MPDLFDHRLRENASVISSQLGQLLSSATLAGEVTRPPRLMAAIRHGVLNGGKRIRPFLLIQSAALFDVSHPGVMHAACALECLHCYSLIHDDLPSMDDDDLRRGQPTVHKAFDEAMAVLAGDALLTFAFDMMSDERISNDATIRATLVQLLARASGQGGMIGGQVLDIAAETKSLNESEILQLQSMKTGALLRFACEAGAVIAEAPEQHRKALTQFGEIIGQAFQLADDLLDVTSNSEIMGKATGKDEAKGKKTLIDYYGIEGSKTRLGQLIVEANDLLAPFGEKANILRQAAQFIIERAH
jgi:farnesyl diphosphate synthase